MENKKLVLNAVQKYKVMRLIEDGRDRFNGMTKSQITRELQPLVDFEINKSNVEYLCKSLGIEPAKSRPVVNASNPDNGVLLDIVELIEDIVSAFDSDDLFSGDLSFAHQKINQLKSVLA